MNIVTRFAPSPTGYLHIGGARTAIFNWLYARHYNGKFLLRIEDTDRQRSTDEAVKAIFDGLNWLGIDYDDNCIRQSDRLSRHSEVASQLLASGNAYNCWTTAHELDKIREKAKSTGRPLRYQSEWRDRDPNDGPTDRKPVIRFKSPRTGNTVIEDLVQGTVKIANQQLDDMILLRSDGTPTYTLSVVVDDHDMGVSHAIRGDDHLTNAARQTQLFNALDWAIPFYAHIPLIHGSDGSKLSKRHGALAVSHYADLGFLPDAMFNYLIRLGWSHGNDEIISRDQAISWFNLDSVGRGPAKFDTQKLLNVNANYIRKIGDANLFQLILPYLYRTITSEIIDQHSDRLRLLLPSLKSRANNLADMAENAIFLFQQRPLILNDKAKSVLDRDTKTIMLEISTELEKIDDWNQNNLELMIRDFASRKRKKMGEIAQPLRAALTGKVTSPGIFDVLYSLGKEETLARLKDHAY